MTVIERIRPARRVLLAVGVVRADKRQIREATRRWQDLYDRLGVDPMLLLLSGRPTGADDGPSPGPEAA